MNRIEFLLDRAKKDVFIDDCQYNCGNYTITLSTTKQNKYTILLNQLQLTCSCGYFKRHAICKHSVFLLQVVGNGIPPVMTMSHKIQLIMNIYIGFSNYKNPKNVINYAFKGAGREITEEDVCAICWCPLEEGTICCPDCGKHLHQICVEKWYQRVENKKCVLCKSDKWELYESEL